MDTKKLKECVKEIKEKLAYLESMLDGEGKEVSSLDELRDKAQEKSEKEDY